MRKTGSFMSFEMLDETSFEVSSSLRQGTLTLQESTTTKVSGAVSSLSRDSKKLHQLDSTYVLEKAYSRVKSAGSSTAVVGILQPENCLLISNLGDSGFIHYRQRDCKISIGPGTQSH